MPPPDTPTLPTSPLQVIAAAAAQTTVMGRQIHKATIISDWLYVTFGDFDANTGPIALVRISLVDHTVETVATLSTEETWNIRESAGEALLPYIDPRGGQETTKHYAHLTGGVWTPDLTITPTPEHVMDAAITSQGLWLSGAAYGTVDPIVGGAPTIWHSADGGTTWTAVLELDTPGKTGYARVYLLMTFGDEMIAAITDLPGDGYRSYHYNGSSWSIMGSPVGPYTDGVPFNISGTPYWLCRKQQLDTAKASPDLVFVVALDPAIQAQVQSQIPATPMIAVTSTATHAWLLDTAGNLYRGDTDGLFPIVAVVDSVVGVASMAVDEARGTVYLCGEGGVVMTATLP